MARGDNVTPIKKGNNLGLAEFDEKVVEIRGAKFTIRELSAEEYDTCLKAANKADGDIDMVLLLRLMVMRSLQEPKMSAEDISKLPYKVSRRLASAVNELHFGDDEED
jgi:hypothetical protein